MLCDLRSGPLPLRAGEPMYRKAPASAGDEKNGQWLKLKDSFRAPVFASSPSSSPLSEVAKYTVPLRTAGELMTHEPLAGNDQRGWPLAASSAYRCESRQPQSALPSATAAE